MNTLKNITLGFVTGRGVYIGENIWTEAGLSRLIDILGKSYNVVLAASSYPEKKPHFDCEVNLKKKDFIALPFMPTIAGGFFRVSSCLKAIREVERKSDIMLVQLPFPSPIVLFGTKKPVLYHICADTKTLVNSTYGFIRYWYKHWGAEIFDAMQKILVNKSNARIITNGSAIFKRYKVCGNNVVSSSIFNREIMSVKRKRKDKTFRILFVSYLRYEKGADILLEAFEKVSKIIPDVELEIIGPKNVIEKGVDKTLREKLDLLLKKNLKIRLSRYVAFGKELFQCYADADVFVLPTRSEGTPRVLVEARAFGCPVIASNVGGIPDSVENEVDGLLIPKDDVNALANAIIRLKNEKTLREKLIKNGIKRARNTTVEAFVKNMIEEIEILLNK